MQKEDKQRVVDELTERLKAVETLFVADYRGLTMTQIDKNVCAIHRVGTSRL